MSAEFYLFDVDHGQCAALRLPNGRWCVFDVGCTNGFSPVEWIVRNEINRGGPLVALRQLPTNFRFLKATVSHLHGDHLADCDRLFRHSPEYLKTVDVDQAYLDDCHETCSNLAAMATVDNFVHHCQRSFATASSTRAFGYAQIRELSLPVAVARQIGGNANSRVNNASVVTRIDIYGNSILVCGDMEKEAWEFLLGRDVENVWQRLRYRIDGNAWCTLVSNVDILVAPHHGHRSGYSSDLLNLARPAVVLVSVQSRDPNVDTRYSQSPVRGIRINGQEYKCITTRQMGHIRVKISPPVGLASPGVRTWTFGEAALQ